MNKLAILLLPLFFINSVFAIYLYDLPYPIVTDNNPDYYIIVGEDAAIEDTLGAVGVAIAFSKTEINESFVQKVSTKGTLSNELSIFNIDKPFILVGGPEANYFTKTLGVSRHEFIKNGRWWDGHALIRLYDYTYNSQPSLVIAGVGASDTKLACELIASEIENGFALFGNNWNAHSVWLETNVDSIDKITIV